MAQRLAGSVRFAPGLTAVCRAGWHKFDTALGAVMLVDTVHRVPGNDYSEAVRLRHMQEYPEVYRKPTADAHSGVQGWSTEAPYSSYMIFCVGNDLAREAAFRAWAAENDIGYKSLMGMYKGIAERSFIVNFDHLEACRPWIKEQESILYLSPLYRLGKLYGERQAFLLYLGKTRWEDAGVYRQVCKEYALQQDAWTYDVTTGLYWVAEKRDRA